jgi:hypothetical protein
MSHPQQRGLPFTYDLPVTSGKLRRAGAVANGNLMPGVSVGWPFAVTQAYARVGEEQLKRAVRIVR